MSAAPDDDLIVSIAPDVMKCLARSGFFEKLDESLCPEDGSRSGNACSGDYRLSDSILRASGFESTELEDIFDVLRSQGGFCDCEILYNVAGSSRLKAQYWRGQVERRGSQVKHEPSSPPDTK